ncbi:mRNA export protein mlo3 [Sanghuangporus baumii]|uniref:mRNA export protein mlo3 n=1 Tax=Sanghuangporus baumii TaxID=108892 RepID=A0A9Q5N235_SANBA|nr:mRNA export protein mlo3 [Sanghuangporus baumii]
MDKSLDETKRTGRRVSRGGRRPVRSARAKVLGTSNTTAAKAAAKKAGVTQPATKAIFSPQGAEKIIVSGLPLDVNEQQIKELFTSTVGPTRSVQLHFNPQGKWTGMATVVFSRQGDANKAYQEYNNRLIDGSAENELVCQLYIYELAPVVSSVQAATSMDRTDGEVICSTERPMKIELIFDPAKVPPPSLTSRVAPATPAAATGGAPMDGVQRTGRVGRGRRGRRVRNTRPQKTAEDLDAEMEDYTSSANPPAAVTAA